MGKHQLQKNQLQKHQLLQKPLQRRHQLLSHRESMFQQEKIFDAVGIHQNAISRNLLHAADVMTRRCCSPPPQSKGVKIIYKKENEQKMHEKNNILPSLTVGLYFLTSCEAFNQTVRE